MTAKTISLMATDITKTQQGLARKAQMEKAHRFEKLYFLLCKREWLEHALQHVLSNEGAHSAGVDGVSWKDFQDVEKNDFENAKFQKEFLDQLQLELKTHKFKPLPVRRVEIPKPGTTKKRGLGIPTIKDRVVQTVLKMVLEPIWESDFYGFSNGFRPTRNTMDCIQPLYALCNDINKYRYVIEGDIAACFDTIPHQRLVAEVSRRIADPKILRLIWAFLKSGLMNRGKFAATQEGCPQGGIFSPLLANIYLHRFDEWYSRELAAPDSKANENAYNRWRRKTSKEGQAAVKHYRYADDFILLIRGTKQQAQVIKQRCKAFLQEELGLTLSEEKTKLTHIKEGFDFLGYHIRRNYKAKTKRRAGLFIRPTASGLKRVKLKIKQMTDKKTLQDNYLEKLKAVNAVVRGWATYYRAVNAYETFSKLDFYVWLRLSKWLERKHRIGPLQVRREYQHHFEGPKGGRTEYAAFDESTGKWIWRYLAVKTKLIYYRPTYKHNWPNPYLEEVKAEHFELPSLKTMWTGYQSAPIAQAMRRKVLGRAKGVCERCGTKTSLSVHHIHRVGKHKRNEADNRPEMLEALCSECHYAEHRAESINRIKRRQRNKSEMGQE